MSRFRVFFDPSMRNNPAILGERLMNCHNTTAPRMPGITDFSRFDIMGVALLSCTTGNATTRAKPTNFYSPYHKDLLGVGPKEQSGAGNDWAAYSSTTSVEHRDYWGRTNISTLRGARHRKGARHKWDYSKRKLSKDLPEWEVSRGKLAITLRKKGLEIQVLPAIRIDGVTRIPGVRGDRWAEINPEAFFKKLTEIWPWRKAK